MRFARGLYLRAPSPISQATWELRLKYGIIQNNVGATLIALLKPLPQNSRFAYYTNPNIFILELRNRHPAGS